MKNKVEDIIETFILKHFLDVYRACQIKDGGDIQLAEDSALNTLKNNIALGMEHQSELVKEELKMFLDFHEEKNGLLDRSLKDQKMYLAERDKQVDEKVKELLQVSKNIIKDKWKQ